MSSRVYSKSNRFSNDFSDKRQLFSLSIWMRIIIIDGQSIRDSYAPRKNEHKRKGILWWFAYFRVHDPKDKTYWFFKFVDKKSGTAKAMLIGSRMFLAWFDILKETEATTFGWAWIVNRNPNIYSYLQTYTSGIQLAYTHLWPVRYARDQQILMRTPLYLCFFFICFLFTFGSGFIHDE